MKKVSFNICLILLLLLLPLMLTGCGGGASSSGPDGGVSGLGFYDYFNGHTWSLIDGSSKTSFVFANGKVTRKDFNLVSGSWVEGAPNTEKPYILTNITDSGSHGTITTEDMFSNNPANFTFTNSTTVVLSYNNQIYTYTTTN